MRLQNILCINSILLSQILFTNCYDSSSLFNTYTGYHFDHVYWFDSTFLLKDISQVCTVQSK